MDLDDLVPRKKPAEVMLGESLATLSVGELEHRINALQAEIERVRAEMERKIKHEAAARALFRS